MKTPTYQKEARQFMGVMKNYRYRWAICSHKIAPLLKYRPIK